mmetsp:Transcript_22134/g.61235  ORF Transcript_22134/g.61235 Transcript_22134/m.61235 type:complete len:334 (-) Transcript_22134:512-1513(-)
MGAEKADNDYVPAADVPTNVRIYTDGQDKDSKPTFFQLLVAYASLTLYTGWGHILMMLAVASIFYQIPRIILALLFGTLLLPAKPVLWKRFNRSWVFSTWRRYFHFSFLLEEVAKKNGRYVFVEFPHGVFPMGPLVAGTLCQAIFPGITIYSLAASSVFNVPGWRHFVAWIGSMPASKSNFKYLLRRGSVAVIVGGIAEMFMQHPKMEQVKLKDRKGFVRIAVEEGADGVVPVYHFGNTSLLDIFPQSAEKFSRRMRAAIVLMYGSFGLPIPRKREVYMVTGKAVPVRHLQPDHPEYEAEVDRVHKQVVDQLQDLYDRHKAEFGWADRPLRIA